MLHKILRRPRTISGDRDVSLSSCLLIYLIHWFVNRLLYSSLTKVIYFCQWSLSSLLLRRYWRQCSFLWWVRHLCICAWSFKGGRCQISPRWSSERCQLSAVLPLNPCIVSSHAACLYVCSAPCDLDELSSMQLIFLKASYDECLCTLGCPAVGTNLWVFGILVLPNLVQAILGLLAKCTAYL